MTIGRRTQTIVLSIEYEPDKVDAPCDWPFTEMLDLANKPGNRILSATWWHDGKDHVADVQRLIDREVAK